LRNRTCSVVFAACLVAWAAPSAAQTPATGSGQASGPTVNLWYLGGNTGVAIVENAGAVVGAEVGFRAWKNLDLLVEGAWMQDLVTRLTLENAQKVANIVQTTQGGAVTSDVKAPTLYGGLGVRWVFENEGKIRPYALVTFGGAKGELQPTFNVNGTETSDLKPYGVTLGTDVSGKYTAGAVSYGGGVVMPWNSWYFDAGVRLLTFKNNTERVNATRIVLGGGYRF
jgi:Outer membrane protein beta-barrel domain